MDTALAAIILVYIFYRIIKYYLTPHGGLNYGKARPQLLRIEELRERIDEIDDFLTDVDTVKRSNNMEIYAYIEYQPVVGGQNKTVKIPVLPNADNMIVLATEERNRLKFELEKPMRKIPRFLGND